MKVAELLDEFQKANSADTGPILVNMNQYAILIKTPEGKFINLPGNCRAAVSGPGFEDYIEKRILMLAGAEYSGPIIYRSGSVTPTEVEVFPKRPDMVSVSASLRPITPEEAQAYGVARGASTVLPTVPQVVEEEVISFGPATADGSPLPAAVEPAPALKPPSPAVAAVEPAKAYKGIPTGAPKMPPKSRLQVMKHRELVQACEKLGIPTTGQSRNQLLSKLLPLAKD